MASRVVSTKLNEDEHKRIMEICSDKGITVSKLLKKTLLDGIRQEKERKRSSGNVRKNQQSEQYYQNKPQSFDEHENETERRFMYY